MIDWLTGLVCFCGLICFIWIYYGLKREKTPLVEPVPDAFPLHYRSPYVPPQHVIGTEGVFNGRPWRRDNQGNPIFGYQPRLDPNRSEASYPALDVRSMTPVGRYYPATDTLEPAPYPQSDRAEPMGMECEVEY